MGSEVSIEEAAKDAFPAEDFRQYQLPAIKHSISGMAEEGKDVIIINAPTGSGKSLILYSILRAYEWDGFFTTPLNSLVDQIEDDSFIEDVITLKGRNNYDCIHPEDRGTSVDKAICQRDDSFECDVKSNCPYYGRKADAKLHPHVVTNLPYLMAEGMIPDQVEDKLDDRDILVIDECQKIEDFSLNFISFTVSENAVPDGVWRNITIPDEGLEDDMEALIDWIHDELLRAVDQEMQRLDDVPTLQEEQVEMRDNLKQFNLRVQNFLDDVGDNDWVAQIHKEVRKNKSNVNKIVFEPIEIGRFLKDLLWSRGDKIILSSATIPGAKDKYGNASVEPWLEEVGLGDANIKKINIPSTFPVENRPIFTDHAVGKMTKQKRRDNAGAMALKIKEIAEHHSPERGFIHCRSYNIMRLLKEKFMDLDYGEWWGENAYVQDKYNREESLENWINSDKQVFFSVAMDEGIDLDGDKCRWQVLAKTLYKHMGNKRVRYRVQERGEWDWYNRHAAIQIQQAYGRAVRSPTDEAVFYILDESAKNLIQMNAELFNGWFLEAIQDLKIDPSRGV